MNEQASLTDKVESLAVATGAIADGSQVIAHDGFDVQAFGETVNAFPKLGRAVNDAQQQLGTGTALLRDLYWSFHKASPRIAPPAPLTPAHEINQQIVSEIMSTAEWRELREIDTVGDAFASALATTGAGEKAIATLGAETMEQLNQLAELASEAEKLWQQAESLQELSALTQLPEKAAQLKAQAEAMCAQAEQCQEQAQQIRQQLSATHEQAVRQAARRGLAEALQEIEQVNQAAEAFGSNPAFGLSPGTGRRSSLSDAREKLSLAQQLRQTPKLQQIAAVCGRFKRLAWHQQKTRVKFPPEEIVSITQGNDLARLLPSELALLADQTTEDLFYLRFAEMSLAQYDLIGHEAQGQGPIILALDESGSMNDPCGPITKEVWSKSVMLGLLSIARWQQRDFAVIHFSSASEIRVDRFPKGRASAQDVIACASHFFNGGTVFDEWMERALQLVDESAYQKADCICLSDGVGRLQADTLNRWQKTKAERGMRAYSILIGTAEGEETLREFSDAVFGLDNLSDDLPALETIFAI